MHVDSDISEFLFTIDFNICGSSYPFMQNYHLLIFVREDKIIVSKQIKIFKTMYKFKLCYTHSGTFYSVFEVSQNSSLLKQIYCFVMLFNLKMEGKSDNENLLSRVIEFILFSLLH